jgi:hypothetical protein
MRPTPRQRSLVHLIQQSNICPSRLGWNVIEQSNRTTTIFSCIFHVVTTCFIRQYNFFTSFFSFVIYMISFHITLHAESLFLFLHSLHRSFPPAFIISIYPFLRLFLASILLFLLCTPFFLPISPFFLPSFLLPLAPNHPSFFPSFIPIFPLYLLSSFSTSIPLSFHLFFLSSLPYSFLNSFYSS